MCEVNENFDAIKQSNSSKYVNIYVRFNEMPKTLNLILGAGHISAQYARMPAKKNKRCRGEESEKKTREVYNEIKMAEID